MSRTLIDPSLLASPSLVNILDNGGLEVWQRGTSFSSPANGAYTADRWKTSHDASPTFVISQESSIVDTGLYSLKLNVTATGGAGDIDVRQLVENYADYRGKTVTASVRVWCNTAANTALYLSGSSVSAQSAAHPGDSAWHTLTVTFTLGASDTQLYLAIGMIGGGGSTVHVSITYIDSVMLTVGPQPATFVSLHPAVDLSRCQRYYRRLGDVSNMLLGTAQAYAATQFEWTLLHDGMRTTPSVVVNNPTNFHIGNASLGTRIACSTFGANLITPKSTQFLGTVASGLVAGNAADLDTENANASIEISADL